MSFFIKKLIKYLLVPYGMVYKAFMRQENEIIILMYHRVNNEVKKELSVKKDDFRWHMNHLKNKKYKVISMDMAYNMLINNELKGKYIVLTFDDGYEDYYNYAFPILKESKFPSIIYLVPGYIETDKVFWWDWDIKESKLMNWAQIIELSKNELVDIGSHTNSHNDMNEISEEELVYELIASKQTLEKKTEVQIKHFSYPRGISTPQGEELTRCIYNTGVLITQGVRAIVDMVPNNIVRLKRIPIQRSDGRFLFIARIEGWLIFEEMIKSMLKKIMNNKKI